MRDELLLAYERELTYLRRLGDEFGKRYPNVAAALQLGQTAAVDPHVERLLEGFAFLAARVQLRLDDDFPDLPQALLDAVYPEYARPIPSMALVQFHLDPEQGKLASGYPLPRESLLLSRTMAGGVHCRFRTCYDTTLWPITVKAAAWLAPHQLTPPVRGTEAVAALRIELETPPDVPFASLELDRLRLYLNAESNIVAALYELLCNHCERILLRRPDRPDAAPVQLDASALVPVGFELAEGVLPVPRRSHVGFRLLTEYFTFPHKFHFLDLTGLERLRPEAFGNRLEIVFLITRYERSEPRGRLEGAVSADTIRLGCSPVINLFPHVSEPVRLTQRRAEYQIVPDARRRHAIAVYSVEGVTAVTGTRGASVHFDPLYSYRHGAGGSGKRPFWHTTRRPRTWRQDEGSDVFLSFVDANAAVAHPDYDSATARLLCYNGDLPSGLRVGDPDGDFDLREGGPVRRIETLVNPTEQIPARAQGPLLWRLVSLLSLNFVSLVEDGPAALQQLLALHNLREEPAYAKQIQAITAVGSGPAYARINSEHGLAFARGHRIDVELDEEQFAGGSAYLFTSILERFFGLYSSLNSFSVLRVRTRQRKEILKEWPPRAGWRPLV